MPEDRIVFPYDSMQAALKDKFAAIGGADAAFKLLRKGYQETNWRKRWEKRAKARAAAEDEAFARETKRS